MHNYFFLFNLVEFMIIIDNIFSSSVAVTAELYIHPKIMGAFASMVLPQLDMPFKGCEFVNRCLESEGWEEKNKKNIAEISKIS